MKIVNIVPHAMSGESHQDSGASIAVNPVNPKEIVIGAYTPDPNGLGRAPVYVSTNEGSTWTLKSSLPNNGPEGTNGITLKFGSSGHELYTAIVDVSYIADTLRTTNPVLGTPMTILDTQPGLYQQPYVAAVTVQGGPDAGKDRVYVGMNIPQAPFVGDGRTSLIRQTMHAQVAAPVFTSINIDSRPKNVGALQDLSPIRNGPQVRPAVHKDGTVYAVFYSWKTWADPGDGNGFVNTDVVIVRDDKWGESGNPYGSLLDSGDGKAGQRIVVNVPIQFYGSLAQERAGGELAIAVDPTNSSIVYVAWADLQHWGESSDPGNTYWVHLIRSTDRGQTWSKDLMTIANGKNPALAINNKGQVGFLYQQLRGKITSQRWETHLSFSQDAIHWSDLILATVPAATPVRQFWPYIGDYADLMTVGTDFYGVFCANNTPNLSNFPQGVTYQRNHNFVTKTLLGLDGVTHVAPSIDPFFFTTAFVPPTVKIPWQNFASVVIILFGIIQDGGGAYIDGAGHIHIVGPGDPGPGWAYLVNLAELRLASALNDESGLQMQKLSLQNIIDLATAQIAQINGQLGQKGGEEGV